MNCNYRELQYFPFHLKKRHCHFWHQTDSMSSVSSLPVFEVKIIAGSGNQVKPSGPTIP
jgi:hypothetical protein